MKPIVPYKFIKKRKKLVLFIIFYLCYFIISSIALYFLEHQPDRDEYGNLIYRDGKLVYTTRCKNILDAFWINVVYVFSGFEDYGPQTLPGKMISLLSFALGLMAVTVVTGKIASYFVLKGIKGGKVDKKLNGHIAICNWNVGGEKIVKEIHASDAEPDVEIIVITQTEVQEEMLRHRPEFEKVFFIKCDPTLHDGLKASRISGAKSVIILADTTTPDPDAVTAMIALAITRLCTSDKRPYIVAEAINHRKMEHLIDAGVDEIICASDFEYGLIAQCSILGKYGKLSQVYQQLLTYTEDGNEIYIIPPEEVPGILIGKNYADACIILLEKRNTNNPVILIGLVRNCEVILNPRNNNNQISQSQPEQILEKDGLVVLAYERPDLNRLLS